MKDSDFPQSIPWRRLIFTFLLVSVLLVGMCLAVLDPARMELIRTPGPGKEVTSLLLSAPAQFPAFSPL